MIRRKLTFRNLCAAALCLGPPNAPHAAIYLHGMDPAGEHEVSMRGELENIARESNVRIALPRAHTPCPQDPTKLCWKQDGVEAVRATWRQIRDESSACFPPTAKPFLIGFSNGGYFASKMLQYCIPERPSSIVAIGSGDTIHRTMGHTLESCGSLVLMIGNRDITRDSARIYRDKLLHLKAHVDLIEFDGGHTVPQRELTALLDQWKTAK